jgi:hypothetical protein
VHGHDGGVHNCHHAHALACACNAPAEPALSPTIACCSCVNASSYIIAATLHQVCASSSYLLHDYHPPAATRPQPTLHCCRAAGVRGSARIEPCGGDASGDSCSLRSIGCCQTAACIRGHPCMMTTQHHVYGRCSMYEPCSTEHCSCGAMWTAGNCAHRKVGVDAPFLAFTAGCVRVVQDSRSATNNVRLT